MTALSEYTEPAPAVAIVCRVCGQQWTKHEDRLRVVEYDVDLDTEVVTRRPAHWTDCIALLKIANQGPVGAPGATGPMGAAGLNA